MKLSNKIIIISGFACLLTIALMVSAFLKGQNNSPGKNGNSVPQPRQEAGEVQNNISKPLKSTDSKEKYMLKIDNDKICAYMILEDGSLSLWNSIKVPPALAENDRKALEKGITTDSFEKLCLYFESYAS